MRPYLVDDRQLRDIRPVQDSQGQADHLQILTAGGGGDVTGLGADVVDNRPLQPGDQEVRALVDHLVLHTGQAVEDDGAATTTDIVDGGVDRVGTGDETDSPAHEPGGTVGSHYGRAGDEDEMRGVGVGEGGREGES